MEVEICIRTRARLRRNILGPIELCGAIAKQSEKLKEYGAQYVDIMIRG